MVMILYQHKCIGQRLNMVMILHARAVTSWGTMDMYAESQLNVKCQMQGLNFCFLQYH